MTGRHDGGVGGALRRDRFTFGPLEEGEALVEPILGSWEANMDHALARSPIDVCSSRGEDTVVLGNLGVVRVLDVNAGSRDVRVREGDLCLLLPFGRLDRFDYAELAYAYDCPGTIGLLAKRSKMDVRLLLPVPDGTAYSLPQWATYGRYFTAWDNWQKAYGCWRTQVADDDPANHLVFGWGGGVAFAELTLAKRAGFRVAMAAGSDERVAFLQENGITPVDRRRFPGLSLPNRQERADRDWHQRRRASVEDFHGLVNELSDGHGVAIFVDNIGEPLYDVTLAALAREGVVTTCGWKAGMRLSQLRGAECISRHIHVNTHVWRLPDSPGIRDFQETEGWIAPKGSDVIYDFDRVPELADDYASGRIGSYFPMYRVNPL
ncbi:zinc-binding alcohol dehydrogenase family protein [Streptomyces sp. ActVer]|uniref:zinc-binding alcohol dehydrogenase family protein n=1 Tax=Streptomyces sp. ActVer TaxID=3014558 RepID=UPI0022B57A5E|nr:zinc-binding alcohol dehydrogenase family protein [Streptomyces sp. ActVer]MCZ4511391.1 zinc-binding alcohol dehydrogenase family protein [Streptomyces sp. ActVer]